MQNFRKIQWIVIENFPDARMDGRTRVNSKVPIPTKVGGPITEFNFRRIAQNASLLAFYNTMNAN